MGWGAAAAALKQGFMQTKTGQAIDAFQRPGGAPTSGVGSLPATQENPMAMQMPEGMGPMAPLPAAQQPSTIQRLMSGLMASGGQRRY